MKTQQCILFFAFCCLGTAFAQEEAADRVEERYGHLEKGISGFKETWINPGTDWTKYDNLYLWEAQFQYRDVGPARRTRMTMLNTRQQEFGILEVDRKRFEELVSEIFVAELQQARNFQLVDQIGPRTLILRGAFLDIISRVPADLHSSEIYLASIGEATLVVELMDASDGEIVGLVAERRMIQSGTTDRIDELSKPANRATVLRDVRLWATRAARELTEELDKAVVGE